MKRPSFQFYPADWRKDPALSACSLAARGLWIELMCIAHEAEEYGFLTINGNQMTDSQLSRMVGEAPKVVVKLLAELEQAAVFSRDDRGAIFSRRMVKDERLRMVRSEAGKLGGNPDLVGVKDKQKDKQNASDLVKQNVKQSPTPSSSSSTSVTPISSSLRSEELSPKSVTFKVWGDQIKSRGESAISSYKTVFDYCQKVGIPHEWLQYAWNKFKERYTEDEKARRKKYIDWRGVFLRAVKGNWFDLWAVNREGQYYLTTVGQQAEREYQEAA